MAKAPSTTNGVNFIKVPPYGRWSRNPAHCRRDQPVPINGMVKEIKLTDGLVALVDDEDYERVAAFSWHARKARPGVSRHTNYAQRGIGKRPNRSTQPMHAFIMQPPPGMVVDHINKDGLDNRKENLRICTRGQNLLNTRARGACKYKGVTIRAQIAVGNKVIKLGSFATAEDAARAYDKAAKEFHGEFAALNFPDE